MRTTGIIATGRLLTCAALALGLTGLSATVAHANNDAEVTKSRTISYDVPFFDSSPCTQEDVSGSGKLVVVQKDKTNPNGSMISKFTSQEAGKAAGVTTSDNYKYSNKTEIETRSSARNYTYRMEILKKIIRVDCPDWKHDDFFLHQKETFKINNYTLTEVSRSTLQKRCK